jgi:Ca2+/Na+ antiporter
MFLKKTCCHIKTDTLDLICSALWKRVKKKSLENKLRPFFFGGIFVALIASIFAHTSEYEKVCEMMMIVSVFVFFVSFLFSSNKACTTTCLYCYKWTQKIVFQEKKQEGIKLLRTTLQGKVSLIHGTLKQAE